MRQGSWFGALSQELQALIARGASLRYYRKQQAIQREGEPAKGLFAVVEGRVHMRRTIAGDNEILLLIAEPGTWFGEHSLRSGSRVLSTATAETPARLLHLPVAALERIVADEPLHFRAFANLVLARYATLVRYLAEGPNLSAQDWLFMRLRHLVAMRRGAAEDPNVITVSQSELATMVGVTRQTLGALLAKLEERALIEVGFRSIRVLG